MIDLTHIARQGRANALASVGRSGAPRLRASHGGVISFSSVRSRS